MWRLRRVIDICHFPNILEFLPADDNEKMPPIVLTVDEYETIRLLDKEGYSQEQCAVFMQIARITVQRIYENARKKIYGGVSGDADEAVKALVNETLDYNPDVKCSHHEHSHEEGHTCGEHGCGSHSCH